MSTPARPELKHSPRSSKQIYRHYREELRQQDQDTQTDKAKENAASLHRRDNFRMYRSVLWLFRWKIFFVLLLAITVALLETAQPRLIGDVVDKILTNA